MVPQTYIEVYIDEEFIEVYEASISVMVTPSIGHKHRQDGSWCFFSSIKFTTVLGKKCSYEANYHTIKSPIRLDLIGLQKFWLKSA